MPAQRVHPASRASHVAHQQLQHRSRANDLRSEAVLRPSHRVNDGADLLGIAILSDRREQVRRFQELIFRDARDALHHLRRVARVLLL